jgi:hypothetical protein
MIHRDFFQDVTCRAGGMALRHGPWRADLFGRYAIVIIVVAITLVLLCKAWQRYRFAIRIRMVRITPKELSTLLASEPRPTVFDVRSAHQRTRSGWIPGSVHCKRSKS